MQKVRRRATSRVVQMTFFQLLAYYVAICMILRELKSFSDILLRATFSQALWNDIVSQNRGEGGGVGSQNLEGQSSEGESD